MKRHIVALAVILLFSFLAAGCSSPTTSPPSTPGTSTPAPKPAPKAAELEIEVKSTSYQYGMFKVTGVVTNVGNASTFSPELTLTVWDSSGKVVLAKDPCWPAGTFLEDMAAGASAGFEAFAMPTGEPGSITWKITAEDVKYTVKYPDK